MGLYNVQDVEALTQWLVKNLDAISDAEPGALAKYILELLNMWTNDPESELRPRLVKELADFLQKEASPFVDRLLAALRSKSYLPYDTSEPPPNPTFNRGKDGRGRKRGLEQDDMEMNRDREMRGPPKGPRRDAERLSRHGRDGQRSRSQKPYERDERRSRERNSRRDDRDTRSDHGPSPPVGPEGQREGCRDFYEFGFCNKGASCPYSHGDEPMRMTPNPPFAPVIPPAMALQMLNGLIPPGFQPPFMQPPLGPHAPYNPVHAQGGLPQPQYQSAYDNGIQDLTPHSFRGRSNRPPMNANRPPNMNRPPQIPGEDMMMADAIPGVPSNEGGQQPQLNGHHERQPSRGGPGFKGRGGRPERSHRSNVADPNALTIVVEKLPPEKVNIPDLSAWFSKFGTVTNVGVDPRGNRALVSFKSHEEAYKAWKSEEAVFGNRFVVIFWHRPAPGGGAAGQKALEASAKTLEKINAATTGEDVDMADGGSKAGDNAQINGHKPSASTDTTMDTAMPKKKEPKSPQEIFEYASRVWMEKMKSVMDVMQSSTATEAEKTEAKAKFKVLKSQKPQPPGLTPASGTATSSTSASTDKKGKPDLDLDMLASGQGGQMSQEEAQAALARLQELAAEKGLDPNGMEEDTQNSPSYGYSYRGTPSRRGWRGGYRGRGRGRGAAAISLASASLDNRTKKVLLKGYDGAIDEDTALDLVQGFYLPTGQAEVVEKGSEGGIVVSFGTRQAAELALRGSPPTIQGLGPLSMQWYNPPTTQPKDGTVVEVAPSPIDRNGHSPVVKTTPAKRPVRGDGEEEDGDWEEDDGGRKPR